MCFDRISISLTKITPIIATICFLLICLSCCTTVAKFKYLTSFYEITHLILRMSMPIPTVLVQINICISPLKKFSSKVVSVFVFNTEYKIYIIQCIFYYDLVKKKNLKYFFISISSKMVLTKIIVFSIAFAISISGIKKFRS